MRVQTLVLPGTEEWLPYLQAHVPAIEVIQVEPDEKPWHAFTRCLANAGDEGYLHIECGTTLTEGFIGKVEPEISRFDGKVPVNFFCNVERGSSERRPARHWVMTQAWWCPPNHAKALFAWLPRWQVHGRKGWANNGRGHWDLAMGDFWAKHKLDYWQVHPSLVQIRPDGRSRPSPTFRDPELAYHPHPELLEELNAKVQASRG